MSRDKMDYMRLLERLYSKIPPRSESGEFRLPELELIRIGEHVIVRNFKDVAERLKRDPGLVSRYLLKELATGGSYDEGTGHLTLTAKISRKTLEEFLQRFEKSYVRCPTCNSIDTRLEKRGKALILVCEACGAEQSVKPF
ncbi:MAG: translation initiation factor IF-2 subunit beta [Acidilobaceae archaeon]